MPVIKTSLPRCTYCGEPAVITKSMDGLTIHECFDCLGTSSGKRTKRAQDTALLIKLGLIKS